MHRTGALIATGLLLAAFFLAAQPASEAQASSGVRGDPIPGDPGFGVELGEDPGTGKIIKLLVYRGQKQVQSLPVCAYDAVPREGPVGSIASADFNFDGHGDLALETAFKDGNASYCIWLFDPEKQRFVESKQLSKLTNPSPDAKTRTVVSYTKGECEPCYHRETYRWSKGQLVPVREESITPAEMGLQLPGGCGWLHTVSEEKNGKMQFVSRSQVNALGQACLP